MLHRDRAVGHHLGQPAHRRVPRLVARLQAVLPGCVKAAEILVEVVEEAQALIWRRFVADVIDRPGEVVDRHQVPAILPWQQPQRDREVLRCGLVGQYRLAGPGLHRLLGAALSSLHSGPQRRHAARNMRRGRRLNAGPIASHDLYLRMARQFDANNDAAVT